MNECRRAAPSPHLPNGFSRERIEIKDWDFGGALPQANEAMPPHPARSVHHTLSEEEGRDQKRAVALGETGLDQNY